MVSIFHKEFFGKIGNYLNLIHISSPPFSGLADLLLAGIAPDQSVDQLKQFELSFPLVKPYSGEFNNFLFRKFVCFRCSVIGWVGINGGKFRAVFCAGYRLTTKFKMVNPVMQIRLVTL